MSLPQRYSQTKQFAERIAYLLKRSHIPHVQVRTSQLPGAGNGVFVAQSIADEELPLPVCLYAGVYTPGMPSTLAVDASDMVGGHQYYGDLMLPSHVPKDENGYVMNLQDVGTGGYLDGMCLENGGKTGRLDINPSSCGHLVNHDASRVNTQFIGFSWDDLLSLASPEIQLGIKDEDTSKDLYDLPNEWRKDGSPWYYDGFTQELQRFPEAASVAPGLGCGGVIVVSKPVKEGDELFLDYNLNKPYPLWAQGWYKGASDL